MKTIVFFLSGIVLVVGLYFGYIHLSDPHYSVAEADYPLYDLQELESNADLIITATLTGNHKEHVNEAHDGALITSFFTISEIVVDQVLQGDVQKGDILQLMEPYAKTNRLLIGPELHVMGPRMPLQTNQRYLLFLAHSTSAAFPEGTLEAINHYQGMHVIQNPDNIRLNYETLEMNEHNDHYENLHRQVMEKYGELILRR